jgi:hypothetical protein
MIDRTNKKLSTAALADHATPRIEEVDDVHPEG